VSGSRARWGLLLALLLVVLAFAVPPLTGWDVHSRATRSVHPDEAPPLHGWVYPRWFGPGTVPAVLLALLGWRYAATLARHLSWRRLLLVSYAASLAWLLTLALVDGTSGLSRVLGQPHEYLPSARAVALTPSGVHEFLQGYVARIPLDSPDNWPTHLAGHPPAIALFFVLLVALGLGGDLAAGVVVTLVAASIAAAVLVTLRALGAEPAARAAAPYLVLTPAAVYLAVSADAVITAVVAWGLACLALATRRGARWPVLAAGSGLLLGTSVLMSYGMPLAGLLALAVLAAGRSWRPLPVAAGAALVVVLAFAAAGFAWWEAYPVLRERYYAGIASARPSSYWLWGNLAALLVCTGPVVAAGLASLTRRVERPVLLLAGAAAGAVLLADLSGMSKAEVERIWLPFAPWLTLSLLALPERWRRPALLGQVVWALLVQHLFYTSW
jgi:methylthioxylose transferase